MFAIGLLCGIVASVLFNVGWRAAELGGGALLAGIAVMGVGTVLVARTRTVSALAAGRSP